MYNLNLKGKYRTDYNTMHLSRFKSPGKVDLLFIPEDIDDLQYFIQNIPPTKAIHVIGAGSNLLLRSNIDGIIIKLGNKFNSITHDNNLLYVGAGTMDINVSLYALKFCLKGFEFLSGIPGNIGGAIRMNAGAYGSEIADIIHSVTAINKLSGDIKTFEAKDIKWKYRGNYITDEWIFISTTFFNQGLCDKVNIENKITEIKNQRSNTQPIKERTGGSTFKNPKPLKAWQLIETANCKGLKIGGAKLSEQHCNFIINEHNATSEDIEDLILEIQKRVHNVHNILLEPEIKIIGHRDK